MPVQPYLFFDGRTEEALEFYKRVLGAEITMLMRFKDAPPMPDEPNEGCAGGPPPHSAEKVMHSAFTVNGTEIMASDGTCTGKPSFQGFSLSYDVPDQAAADRVFGQLAEGGQVQMPLAKTFFSPRFGMVADRFGVTWMVIVPPPEG